MSMATLSEFQALTGLSDSAVLWILSQNQVHCQVDAEKGIMIDTDSAELQTLIQSMVAKQSRALEEQHCYIAERFARIISENLDEILEAALSRRGETES